MFTRYVSVGRPVFITCIYLKPRQVLYNIGRPGFCTIPRDFNNSSGFNCLCIQLIPWNKYTTSVMIIKHPIEFKEGSPHPIEYVLTRRLGNAGYEEERMDDLDGLTGRMTGRMTGGMIRRMTGWMTVRKKKWVTAWQDGDSQLKVTRSASIYLAYIGARYNLENSYQNERMTFRVI